MRFVIVKNIFFLKKKQIEFIKFIEHSTSLLKFFFFNYVYAIFKKLNKRFEYQIYRSGSWIALCTGLDAKIHKNLFLVS